MEKTNVLYLIDKLEVAGAQRHLAALLKRIDRGRFSPRLVCLSREGHLTEEIRSLDVPVTVLDVKRIYDLTGIRGLFRLVRILKRERIDVLHAYLFSENILGALAARLAGTRIVLTSRRDTGRLREGKRRHFLAYRLTNRWVDRVVCVSDAVKRVVLEKEKAAPEKVTTIPNGAEGERSLAECEKYLQRDAYGLSEKNFLVTLVANLSWIKGHRVFLDAASRVKAQMPEARFWVIGEGPLRKALEERASELGLSKHVRFFGRVADSKSLLRLSDVSVNTSFSEGMSNTLLESMALGIPVVATGVDGNLETVIDEESGLLVPPGDPEALAETIHRLGNDKKLRQRIGEAGRVRIKTVLSLDRMIRSVEQLYGTLLSPKVQFIFSKFPCYDETFILREMRELKKQGLGLSILSLKRGKDPVVHGDATFLVEETFYLPFLSWGTMAATVGMFFTKPLRFVSTLGLLIAKQWRDPEFLIKSIAIFPKSVALAGSLRKRNIRHLHAEWATHPATSAWVASRFSGIPYSFTGHAHDIYLKKTFLPEKLEAASFVTTCTRDNKRYLAALKPEISPSKIHVCYHGVDLERFRRNGNAVNGKILLLSVGSLLACKGFEDLIEACLYLKREGFSFECLVIGGGPQEAALRRKVARLDLTDSVRLLGYMKQEELVPYYKRADLFALPARLDRHWGIPNVLLEAMAAEVPVLCTPLPSIPELIQDQVNGLLVPERDPKKLSEAISRLIRNESLRRKMGEAAFRTVSEHFDAVKNGSTLLRLFEEKIR